MGKLEIPDITLDPNDILATFALVASYLLLRLILLRVVRKWSFKDAEQKRKWIVQQKNLLLLVLVVGLLFIWGQELRTFAISLVAVAVAFVIATKEIILCLMGGVLKASTKLFEVGDRIEIGGMRGEVTDHNFLMTNLFEVGPGDKSNQFTGRTLKIPNSKFLTENIVVEPSGKHFTLAVFRIPLPVSHNLKAVEQILLECAFQVLEPYGEKADRHIQRLCTREGVQVPDLKPRILYDLKDKDTIEYHVRMPVPFNKKSGVEKTLLELFFEKYLNQGNP